MNQTATRIRPMEHADLIRVFEWRNHPEIRRYMYSQHEIQMSEHERWFENSRHNPMRHLLIFEVANIPQGFVNFGVGNHGKIADWGFYIAPTAPRGTGQSLGKCALDYAFTNLCLHKVCGEALAFNEKSIGFHSKLGFKQEGILREQHFDGEKYIDVVRFGLLQNEWNG